MITECLNLRNMQSFKTAKLEIVVPTYNRPACVADMMEKYAEYLSRGLDFSVSVWDSSTDDETEKIMRGYISERVRYIRKPSDTDVDEKTMICLHESTGEYVHLCGDGYTLNAENLLSSLSECGDAEIIAVYDSEIDPMKLKKLHSTERKFGGIFYDNKDEFFADQYNRLMLYAGSLCRGTFLRSLDTDAVLAEFKGSGLIYPSALAAYSHGSFVVWEGRYFVQFNKGKKQAGWITHKQAMAQWTEKFCVTVEKLRGRLSESAVDEIIETLGEKSDFFTLRGLIRFRETDNYNLKLLKKYKPYFKRVKACSMFTAYLIALMPKWLCKSIHKTYRKLKGLDKKEKDA